MHPALQNPPPRQLLEQHHEVREDDQRHRLALLNANDKLLLDVQDPHEDPVLALPLLGIHDREHAREVVDGRRVHAELRARRLHDLAAQPAQVGDRVGVGRRLGQPEPPGLALRDVEQLAQRPDAEGVQAELEEGVEALVVGVPLGALAAIAVVRAERQVVAGLRPLGELGHAGQHGEGEEGVVARVAGAGYLRGDGREGLAPVALRRGSVEVCAAALEAREVRGGDGEAGVQHEGVVEADFRDGLLPERDDAVQAGYEFGEGWGC